LEGELREESKDGVEAELAFEILLRTLSLGVNVDDTVSSSLTESLSPRSRGTEEEELPDTVLAMESFFLWFATGVIRLRNLDSLLLLPPVGGGSTWQESSCASLSSMMRIESNHFENFESRSIV
jgi:hypothetical protein